MVVTYIFQMATKYTNIVPTYLYSMGLQNLDFWFENKPSGDHDSLDQFPELPYNRSAEASR
jgi:hypothetical protein